MYTYLESVILSSTIPDILAQRNWTMHNNLGRPHQIGLYHGEDSGHLVVHLNNRVLLIDFNILDSKTYSFFIDQELCELNIVRGAAGDFSYQFAINYEADTPQNRLRKQRYAEDNRSVWQAILLAILVFTFFFLLAFFISSLQET